MISSEFSELGCRDQSWSGQPVAMGYSFGAFGSEVASAMSSFFLSSMSLNKSGGKPFWTAGVVVESETWSCRRMTCSSPTSLTFLAGRLKALATTRVMS